MSVAEKFAQQCASRFAESSRAPPAPKPPKRKLLLKMDTREANTREFEAELRAQLAAADMGDRLVLETLNLYDFIFVHADNPTEMFGPGIERKTADDLASSIKGPRWKEQRARMASLNQPMDKIIYVVEGDIHHVRGLPISSMNGAVLKPAMRGEHQSALTPDMRTTCKYLVAWLNYLERVDEPSLIEHYSYVDGVQSQVRKSDFTENNQLAILLVTIAKGVSPTIAKGIADTFITFSGLQVAFIRDRAGTLKRIADMHVDGRQHRVGPAIAETIAKVCDVEPLRAALSSPRAMHRSPSPPQPGPAARRKKVSLSALRPPAPLPPPKKRRATVVVVPDDDDDDDDDEEDDEVDEIEE